ncbi:MAG: rod shape-determining protein MreD [Dysgonamonadaceae bacterium]|jgi:rod shape-determining protein MreD|nr:rod shape-determining protein MreD [Dysgonamonadaceae bacterium]
MNVNTIKAFFLFIFLILLQVWVLNHVHVRGLATPLLYVYFILKLSSGNTRSSVLFASFAIGLVMDIFNNTPGMNALASTVAGFLRYYVLNLFSSKEEKSFIPSTGTMGMGAFSCYAAVVILLHHIALFCVEAFSFFSPLMLMLKIVCSSVLTLVLVFAMDAIRFDRVKR